MFLGTLILLLFSILILLLLYDYSTKKNIEKSKYMLDGIEINYNKLKSEFSRQKLSVQQAMQSLSSDLEKLTSPNFSQCKGRNILVKYDEIRVAIEENILNGREKESTKSYCEQIIEAYSYIRKAFLLAEVEKRIKQEEKSVENIECRVIPDDKGGPVLAVDYTKFFTDTRNMLIGETNITYPYCPAFDQLIKLCEQDGEYSKAISVCEKALLFGLNSKINTNFEDKLKFLKRKITMSTNNQEIPPGFPGGLLTKTSLTRISLPIKMDERVQKPTRKKWKSQDQLFRCIKELFPEYEIECEASPEWLGRQRLDIYIPSLSLAIEYHGKQHFLPVDYFGGENALVKTRQLDTEKYEKCLNNKVKLVYFSFEESISIENVRNRLIEFL